VEKEDVMYRIKPNNNNNNNNNNNDNKYKVLAEEITNIWHQYKIHMVKVLLPSL
jgi:hypothetical protein